LLLEEEESKEEIRTEDTEEGNLDTEKDKETEKKTK